MKTIARLSILFVLIVVQALAPVSAEAHAQAPVTPAPSSIMSPALYSAFLNASAKTAAAFQANASGYSVNSGGLQAQVNANGLSASPASGKAWTWDLALNGFGRPGQTAALAGPKVAQAAGMMKLNYAPLSEWYRNSGIGLEQGFTINQKPAGTGQLMLHMQLITSLTGVLSKDSRSLTFAAGHGQVLHYSDLRAEDANGQELNASLVYTQGQISIQIDDRAAAYPLMVDPIAYIETELDASDGAANDYFGISVAISGDTAVVGAYQHKVGSNVAQGAAYIFVRQGITWAAQAELTASDGAASDHFGYSVAISGDTALVGAYNHNSQRGEAYVFVEPSGGWSSGTETGRLTASDGVAGDLFGISVAISGDTALVGAHRHNNSQGEAYVFVEPAGGWVTSNVAAILTIPGVIANAFFGCSVAISGDTALVGAYGINSNQGMAYVFVKPSGGWISGTPTAYLAASGGAANDDFGRSVAISGDTALVGAPNHQVGSYANQGVTYVFVKPAGGWVNSNQTATLTASDGFANDNFGESVAISGDTALIGAWGHNSSQGEAYVFVKPTSGWITSSVDTILAASDGAANDNFGLNVAISGDTAFIGAQQHNISLGGAAYVYYPYRSEDVWVNAAASTLSPLVGQTVTFTVSATNLGNPTPAVMLSAPLADRFQPVHLRRHAGHL